jgi:pimeloyl-ACP methyl ester carboxylesterase
MLAHGYALAGSSYASTGWAIEQALPDQISTLNTFDQTYGQPKTTVAWGHSLGGIITAGLIQDYPSRFDAALPMCGVLSGGVATWNTGPGWPRSRRSRTLRAGSRRCQPNPRPPTTPPRSRTSTSGTPR